MKYCRPGSTLWLSLLMGMIAIAACDTTTRGTFETWVVDRGEIRAYVTAIGTLQPFALTHVSSQLSGQVVEVLADFNDHVRRGQPLVQLDRQSFVADQQEAQAALDLARSQLAIREAGLAKALAQLRVARAQITELEAGKVSASADHRLASEELERQRALQSRGTTSVSALQTAQSRQTAAAASHEAAEARLAAHGGEIDAAQAEVQIAEAQIHNAEALIRQRQAALTQANVNLDRTVIRAPFDGVVIRRNIEQGQTVASSLQAPTLFTLAKDLANIQVETRVDEADIGAIERGQTAEFQVDAYPNRRYSGTVEKIHISPELVQNVVTYTVVIAAENPDLSLLPGMTATVRILVAEHPDTLRLPNAALRFRPPPELAAAAPAVRPGYTRIWIASENGAQGIDVVPGPSDDAFTAVADGPLLIGQHVIVGPGKPR